MTFIETFKRAMTDSLDTRLVLVNNFEVERVWARGGDRLPGADVRFAAATVNRMEELGMLLAGPHDVIVLKEAVDNGYLDYLRSLGVEPARQVLVDDPDATRSVTEDALAAPELRRKLAAMADGRTYLCPLGTSHDEERLASETGLPLLGANSTVARRVNSKIYSRELGDRLQLRAVPGAVTGELDELPAVIESFLAQTGRCTVKEPLGVSGRGQVLVKSVAQAASLSRLISRAAQGRTPRFVVEAWLDDVVDVNYQVLVARSGEVSFLEAKEAVVEGGVHRGHLFPPRFGDRTLEELRDAGERIGDALFTDGYTGVVGIDALLAGDGTLYPCLEINARFNASTYQNELASRVLAAGRCAQAGYIAITGERRIAWDELAGTLGPRLAPSLDSSGLIVTNFATVNAGVERRSAGRLYFLAVGSDVDEVAGLHAWAERRIAEMAVAA